MTETSSDRKRGNSRPNVKRRGSTYTYYIYVTDADGRRRQHSKGGFRTQRAAEDARIEALSAMANAAYVKPERTSVGAFLLDEWLPSRRPPVLMRPASDRQGPGCVGGDIGSGLARGWGAVRADRKSTRLNSSHALLSRMPSSA